MRQWVQDYNTEAALFILCEAMDMLNKMNSYVGHQPEVQQVIRLPEGPESVARTQELRMAMHPSISVMCEIQSFSSWVRAVLPPLLTRSTVFAFQLPPLPDTLRALFFTKNGGGAVGWEVSQHHQLACLLLFIVKFDLAQAPRTLMTNDLAFFLRGRTLSRTLEDSPFTINDLNSVRYFITCHCPMFAAIESLMNELSAQTQELFLEKCGNVITMCDSLLSQGCMNSEQQETVVFVLTAAIIMYDRVASCRGGGSIFSRKCDKRFRLKHLIKYYIMPRRNGPSAILAYGCKMKPESIADFLGA